MVSRRSTRSRQSDDKVPGLEEDLADLAEDEIEEEEEDEVEEVTRCICGNPELQLAPNNPDIDDIDPGFFIQCEDCQVWQHGYCVGIKDEVDAPDKYWCELCKPELHTLIYKGPKDKRSLYTPVTDKKKKPHNRRIKEEKEETKKVVTKPSSPTSSSPTAANNVTRTTTNNSAHQSKHSSSPETRHRRERSRGTLNSRDAEYELMLKKALEESAKESGVQPEDPELSEYTRDRVSRRRTRHDDEIKKEDETADLDTKSSTRHGEDESQEESKDLGQPESKRRKTDSLHNSDHSDLQDTSLTATVDTTALTTEDNKKTLTVPTSEAAPVTTSTLNELSENDSSSVSRSNIATASAAASKKKRPRRAVNSKSKNDSATMNNNNSSPKKNRSKEEIDADKPTKPRLPQQRISMYEMRKRTSAILEFLVRTQSELKEDFENGVDITEFIDDNNSNKSEINKDDIKSTLKNGYDESVNLMENLTRKIIDWNTKYGESSV